MRAIGKIRSKYHICEMLSYAFTFADAQAYLHSLSPPARLFLKQNYDLIAVILEDYRYLPDIQYALGENWTSEAVNLGQVRAKKYKVLPQEGIRIWVQTWQDIVRIGDEGLKVTELKIQ
jgi:hypothetical protein